MLHFLTPEKEDLCQTILGMALPIRTLDSYSTLGNFANHTELARYCIAYYLANMDLNGDSLFDHLECRTLAELEGCLDGNQFLTSFATFYVQPIVDSYQAATVLMTTAQRILTILRNLNTNIQKSPLITEKEKTNWLELYSDINRQLTLLINSLNQFDAVMENASSLLQQIESKLKTILFTLTAKLIEKYTHGSITPGRFTDYIRPTLCMLLQAGDVPRLLNKEEAEKLDNRLRARHNYFTFHVRIPNILNDCPLLIDNFNSSTRPLSYGKPLTYRLLANCVMHWRHWNNSLSSLFTKVPEFIQGLITMVNGTSGDIDQGLSQKDVSTVESLLRPHLSLVKPREAFEKNALARIVLTLLVTSTCATVPALTTLTIPAGADLEPKNQNDHSFTIYHLRKLLALHTRANKAAYQGIFLPLENAKAIEAPLKEKSLPFFKQEIYLDPFITELEVIVHFINYRHDAEETNFELDLFDLLQLKSLLASRWESLLRQPSSQSVQGMLTSTNPVDRISRIMAEMLGKALEAHNVFTYYYELLMPHDGPLPTSSSLKSRHPPGKTAKYGVIEPENSTINDIAFENLVITRTGYFFDINWIIHQYQTKNSMINEYTEQEFTREELTDMCSQSFELRQQLLSIIKKRLAKATFIVPGMVNALEELLNGVFFVRGYNHYYTYEQNQASDRTHAAFDLKMNDYPPEAREAFLAETIPGTNDYTLRDVLNRSEGGRVGEDRCVTGESKYYARLVYAYKGQKMKWPDGLEDDYDYTKIQQRHYSGVEVKLTELESFLVNVYEHDYSNPLLSF